MLSGFHVAAMPMNGGSQLLGFAVPQLYVVCHWQAYVPSDVGLWPMPEVH